MRRDEVPMPPFQPRVVVPVPAPTLPSATGPLRAPVSAATVACHRLMGARLRKGSTDQPAAAAEFIRLESDWEASYLLTMRAAWMADNKQPNSLEASMSKAKAGRTVNDVTNKAVELASTVGYSERILLEK